MVLAPLLSSLLLTAAGFTPQISEPTTWPIEIGQPAPPIGIAPKAPPKQEKAAQSKNAVSNGTGGKVEPRNKDGNIRVIHLMKPGAQDATFHTLPLLRDLLTANTDRGMSVTTLLPELEDLDDFRQTYGVSWDVVEFQPDSKSPFLNNHAQLGNYVWLIGRSGFVAWHGDPKKEEKALLKMAASLLQKSAAPALQRPLDPELNKAVAAYREGKWENARKHADKLKKKYGGQASAEEGKIFDDALHLSSLVSEHEVELLNQALKALDKKHTVTFFQLKQAIEVGFPKSDIRKQLEQSLKEFKKGEFVGTVLDDGAAMVEALEDRPVLFPARKSSHGDRLEEELQKMLKRSNNDIEPNQLARQLLEKYAAAHRIK